MDFIENEMGKACGSAFDMLVNNNMDPAVLRPYRDEDGKSYIDVMNQRSGEYEAVRLENTVATLRREDWLAMDKAIVEVARQRLRAVQDLIGAGATFNIPNGMSKTVLQTETMSDISDAQVDMDGVTKSQNDRPVFEPTNLPLPITHKDFMYTARGIAVTKSSGSPIDTTTARLAARKVSEAVEKQLVGVAVSGADQFAYGGGIIYGYTDFPSRITRTITAPTDSAWTGNTLLLNILAMMQDARDAFHYGPYMLYFSSPWEQYLGQDFKTGTTGNVRNRILETEGITDIRILDFLPTTNFDIILVQMTSDVVREVTGMGMTTVQWPEQGGMRQNFKVMTIMVPQLRADQNGNTGIVHGTSS